MESSQFSYEAPGSSYESAERGWTRHGPAGRSRATAGATERALASDPGASAPDGPTRPHPAGPAVPRTTAARLLPHLPLRPTRLTPPLRRPLRPYAGGYPPYPPGAPALLGCLPLALPVTALTAPGAPHLAPPDLVLGGRGHGHPGRLPRGADRSDRRCQHPADDHPQVLPQQERAEQATGRPGQSWPKWSRRSCPSTASRPRAAARRR